MYIFNTDDRFTPSWRLDNSWVLCTCSWVIMTLSALGLSLAAYYLPEEGGYELIPSRSEWLDERVEQWVNRNDYDADDDDSGSNWSEFGSGSRLAILLLLELISDAGQALHLFPFYLTNTSCFNLLSGYFLFASSSKALLIECYGDTTASRIRGRSNGVHKSSTVHAFTWTDSILCVNIIISFYPSYIASRPLLVCVLY